MQYYFQFDSAYLYWIVILLCRYAIPWFMDQSSGDRISEIPPMSRIERKLLVFQYFTFLAMFIYSFLLPLPPYDVWFYIGTGVFFLMMLLHAHAIYMFIMTPVTDFTRDGIYRYSRHPMHLTILAANAGIALATQSLLYGGMVLLAVITTHQVIIGEERACRQKFGEKYRRYAETVHRYLGRG